MKKLIERVKEESFLEKAKIVGRAFDVCFIPSSGYRYLRKFAKDTGEELLTSHYAVMITLEVLRAAAYANVIYPLFKE